MLGLQISDSFKRGQDGLYVFSKQSLVDRRIEQILSAGGRGENGIYGSLGSSQNLTASSVKHSPDRVLPIQLSLVLALCLHMLPTAVLPHNENGDVDRTRDGEET